jgi:hypothetical protein
MLYVNSTTMAPSCWKEFIYVVCCFLGDDYLDEIYEYEEKERLCPRQPSLQTNKQSMKKTNSNSDKNTTKKIKWILGDQHLS